MEQARSVLKNTAKNVDITIARSPTPPPPPTADECGGTNAVGRVKSTGPKPLARRKRRLPVIERPKSAPLSGENGGGLLAAGFLREQAEALEESNYVLDVCDFSQEGQPCLKNPGYSLSSDLFL
jgi:hypothetical protein